MGRSRATPDRAGGPARLRIALYIPSLGDGGAQRQCVLLANELSRLEGVDVILVTLAGGPHERLVEPGRYVWRRLGAKSKYDRRALWRLRQVLVREEVDVVISWIASADIQAFIATRGLRRTKWIMTQRNSAFTRSLRHSVRDRIGRFADAIVSNSIGADSYWDQKVPRVERFIIPNIVSLDAADPGPQSAPPIHRTPRNEKYAIVLGRLHPQKGAVRSVEALIQFCQERSDVRGLVVGQGPLEGDLAALLERADEHGRVTMLGYRTDAHDLIRNAAVLLTLSRHEGLPNVVLESAALGTPIVASKIPEHVAVLGTDYPYYVADTATPHEVASVLDRASRDSASPALAHAQRLISEMSGPTVADKFASVARRVRSKDDL